MFESLFSEISIGSLTVSNRVVLPAMNTRTPTEDGYVTERGRRYYEERANGGAGLITFESTYPCHPHPYRHHLVDDSYIEGISGVVDTVHDAGTNIAIQMNMHRGSSDHLEPLAPAPLTKPDGTEIPGITSEKMQELIEQYAAGADRAKRAGIDGIEIHAASGYLMNSFLSPRTNNRTDEYGGSTENRTRFARETLSAVRNVVGEDFPVWFRFPGHEFIDDGITPEIAPDIARSLVAAGADAINITAGHSWNGKIVPSGYAKRGVFADISEQVKQAVDVPVFIVGRINDPEAADEIISAGKADLVAMARAHLADPHFVRKAKNGELDRIRRCVGGLEGCWDALNGAPVGCSLNALVGRESDLAADVADPKTIVVVGGGPAGLEVARVAGKRGHSVTLYEKESEIGGQLRWAQHAPAKREYTELLRFFTAELDAYDVTVECQTELTTGEVAELEADEVIVATGSVPRIPTIEGLSEGVQSGMVVLAEDVLTGEYSDISRAVVFGGTEIASDTAEYLAERETPVTLVSRDKILGNRVTREGRIGMREKTLNRFAKNEYIELLPNSRLREIDSDEVRIVTDGNEQLLGCDHVILAPERESTRSFDTTDLTVPVTTVGDAESPRDLHTAIHEGNEIGMAL